MQNGALSYFGVKLGCEYCTYRTVTHAHDHTHARTYAATHMHARTSWSADGERQSAKDGRAVTCWLRCSRAVARRYLLPTPPIPNAGKIRAIRASAVFTYSR